LIFYKKKELENHLSNLKKEGKRIGLVPTMGALHQGHLTLIDYIKDYCDVRVCSIFVNPTQFNNSEDLQKYPRPIEKDTALLEQSGCDLLFMPEVDEMYGDAETWHIDLGELDTVLEGAFRPGHFQGVTQVVKKLFDIIKPDVASFGQKDYQQYLVIEKMTQLLNIPVKLVLCPIIRERSGLAMSSRNVRLSETGREQALSIYRSLKYVRDHITCQTIHRVKAAAIARLKTTESLSLEYFEICNKENLQLVTSCES